LRSSPHPKHSGFLQKSRMFCRLRQLRKKNYIGLSHDLHSYCRLWSEAAPRSNTVPSRVLKIALQRQKSKQILRKSNLQSALHQAAPPKLVGCSRRAKKKNAFDKYILSPSSNNTIARLRYGENSAPRKDPEKFRATLANCGWFGWKADLRCAGRRRSGWRRASPLLGD
jgi:hypothetical protein